ncbi:MAG: BON domain-containing protein [Bacteriovoracaceae bacterium]|nr:BON domain-containing protein [Bacteriovoracaceae bacterium]
MSRKINDGAMTGLKQDRFRNSRFEYDKQREPASNEGVRTKTANTIGGPYEENRGHREAEDIRGQRRFNSPFENGRLYNWNRRQGWDQYYNDQYHRGTRNHGGAQLFHDMGHAGKGPKGYKRSDEAIYEDVCLMLESSQDVDASEIEVSVKDGCVFLNGTIQSRLEKRMAEIEIEHISGVRDVQNLLRIKRSGEELH